MKNSQSKDLTFQPTFFTSKDTLKKFCVSDKVGALTAQAGGQHVERYAKARAMQEEAERKLYGRKGSAAKGTQVQYGHAGYATSAGASQKGVHSVAGPESEDTMPSSTPAARVSSPLRCTDLNSRGGYEFAADQDNVRGRDADRAAEAALQREYSVVEVLERERREWHSERVKLVQCIHLQQLELAARASAAQETAGAIAKEFAHAIESYDERLLVMENLVKHELADIKALIVATKQNP